MRVPVDEAGHYTYPDLVVACKVRSRTSTNTPCSNPVLIVEVLSSPTESYDLRSQLELYGMIPFKCFSS